MIRSFQYVSVWLISNTDSQAIAELINRQRRDQETMFRAFTNGIPIFLTVLITRSQDDFLKK